MHIAIGSDHAGLVLKGALKGYMKRLGYRVTDFGTFSEESCDYPDYAVRVAKAVADKTFQRGVLICNTGIGMAIAANKVSGVRAALCWDMQTARSASSHNKANVLCLSQKLTSLDKAKKMLKVWIDTPFSGGRHLRRVKKISSIEKKYLEK
ncbi:MAG: ribose 5-phosphate isomerase B [bacterium]